MIFFISPFHIQWFLDILCLFNFIIMIIINKLIEFCNCSLPHDIDDEEIDVISDASLKVIPSVSIAAIFDFSFNFGRKLSNYLSKNC